MNYVALADGIDYTGILRRLARQRAGNVAESPDALRAASVILNSNLGFL